MSHSPRGGLGSVVSLWRYPVKSMMGEELNASEVTEYGLVGDRGYALVDSSNGKVGSAKNPRTWPRLFDFRAAFVDTPRAGAQVPPVRITLPDGNVVSSAQADVNRTLSLVLNREVTLEVAERAQPNSWTPRAEAYWPDMAGLDYRNTVTEFELPRGTFFDGAVVHVLTTATIDRLRQLYPLGRFEVRRFRPNLVVQTDEGVLDFVENAWIGHTLAIGDQVRLSISRPCGRCVMTTLAQGDLPGDPGILRTVAQHNQAKVGVYASVERGGTVRRGDVVSLE